MKRLRARSGRRLCAGGALIVALTVSPPLSAATVDGWLAPARPVPVGAAVSGRIAGVHVTPGQRVNAGDVLVELDDSAWVAERDAAQAHVKAAAGARDEADRERKRTEDMFDRTLISEHELNLARNAYAAAAADYSRASAALADAQQRMAWSRVTAPFAATVVEVTAYTGQAVANGCAVQALVTLVPLAELRVIAPIGTDARVYPGQTIAVSVDDASLPAIVQSVTAADPDVLLEARLPIPQGSALHPGQTLKVSLP